MSKIEKGKPKTSRLSTLIKYIFIFSLALAIVCVSFVSMMDKKLTSAINLTQPYLLTIEKGTTFHSLSREFVKLSWVETRFWLRSYGKIYPNEVKIKAGTYKILPNTRIIDLLEQVVSGKEHQFSITFIEGSTFKDSLKVLAATDRIEHTLANKTIAHIAKQLKLNHTNPEGLLFPDTYAFISGTSDLELLKRASNKLNAELSTLWDARADNLPYETAYQALIMASIIEKETSYIPEQPLISSVFVNRLAKRMRLQTDPTIIYGLGERYTGDIT